MKAARLHRYGGLEALQIDDVPAPSPAREEVLIQVAATSFVPSDVALRKGLLREVLPLEFPFTLGWDVSGTVVEAGEGATRWRAGDRVIGRLDGGGAADYVTAPQQLLARAPSTVPLQDAAAVPVSGLTAWQAVFEWLKPVPGERVLVNGAGGGVGAFAVPLVKLTGAKVIATAGPRSRAAVAAAGADEIIDYTSEPLPADLDAVLNLAAITDEAATALAGSAGRTVSIATPVPGGLHFVTRNDPSQLAELVGLIEAGRLPLQIAETHPLTALPDLHRRSEAGGTRGKIVLIPQQDLKSTTPHRRV